MRHPPGIRGLHNRLLLLPSRDVLPLDEARAAVFVETLMKTDSGRAQLRELVGSPELGDDELRGRALDVLPRAGLVLLRFEQPRTLDEPRAEFITTRDDPGPEIDSPRPTWIAVEVVVENGTAAPGLRLVLTCPDGSMRDIRLDADSRFRADDIPRGHGVCELQLEGPAHKTGRAVIEAREGDVFVDAGRPVTIDLACGRAHRIVVRLVRPHATFLEFGNCCFHTDRAILLPHADSIPDHEPGLDRVPGLTLARTTLEFVASHPAKRLFVAGHTDRAGSAGHNQELAELRAENVQLYIHGDSQGWAEHCQANHEIDDVQRILAWCDQRFPEYDCYPGLADNDFGSLTQSARDRFRAQFAEQSGSAMPTGRQDVRDWLAFFELYDRALAEDMNEPVESIRGRKQALVSTDPAFAGFGESFPVDAPAQDGYESERNRRVEILFVDPTEELELDSSSPRGAHIFGPEPTFVLNPIHAHTVRRDDQIGIRVVDPRGNPIPRQRFRLTLTDGSQFEGTLDDDGVFIKSGIEPGTYVLDLIDLDARDWSSTEHEPLPPGGDHDDNDHVDNPLDDEIELVVDVPDILDTGNDDDHDDHDDHDDNDDNDHEDDA